MVSRSARSTMAMSPPTLGSLKPRSADSRSRTVSARGDRSASGARSQKRVPRPPPHGAVDAQAGYRLERPHATFGLHVEAAVWPARGDTQRDQGLLQPSHAVSIRPCADAGSII